MKARRKLRVALVLASAISCTPLIVHADERSDARRHFRAGMELITQRHFPEGIAELEAAYAILPHPNVLYNIARAYNDQGNTERAIDYLRRYLLQDVPDRSDVETILARLEGRQRQQLSNQNSTAGSGTTAVTTATTRAVTTPATAGGTATTTTTASAVIAPITLPAGASGQPQDLRNLARSLLQMAEQLDSPAGVTTSSAAPRGDAGVAPSTATATTTSTTTATTTTTAATVVPAPEANVTAVTTTTARSAANLPVTGPVAPAPGETVNVGARGNDDQYEERIVTASRAAQSPLDAPNATGVITSQDIRLSGMTNVPALLRRIAGVDLMVLDESDVQVSIRGFNQRLSNKVLVLVDGRSVFLDFLGGTLWPAIPQSIEDIERIEVIRGPGSALYGADAFSGVINIITRPPGESRTAVSFGGGNGSWFRGAFTTSGRQGGLSFRASASYEQRATYNRPVADNDQTYRVNAPDADIGFRAPRVSIDLRAPIGRVAVLRGGFGVSGPTTVWFNALGPLRRYWADLVFMQPYVQIDAGGFSARVFWNRFTAQAAPLITAIGQPLQGTPVQSDVVDAIAEYALRTRIGSIQNTLQVGLGYRFKYISWSYLDGDHRQNHGSAYLQETLRVSDLVTAVVSVRADVQDDLPSANRLTPSVRGSLITHPTPGRTLRLTAGNGFRTPTFVESYVSFNNTPPIPGVAVRAEGGTVRAMNGRGQQLVPERVFSVDLGYLDHSFDRMQFEANVFFTRGDNTIQLSEIAFDPLGGMVAPVDATDRRINIGRGGFFNDPAATYVYGAEVGLRVSPIDGLDLFANYTLSLTAHDTTSLLYGDGTNSDQRTPVHKLNVGVQARTPFGLDLELFAHYVSSQRWYEQVFDVDRGIRYQSFAVNDYFVVNGRVGYRLLNDRLDVGLVGSNIADPSVQSGHVEHPFGNRLSVRVLATASYRF